MPAKVPKLVLLGSASSAESDDEGSVPAVTDALNDHLDSLYATARLLTRDHAAAEDLVQETAVAAFRAWGQLRTPSAVRGWLLRILRNRFLNTRRQASRRPPLVDMEIDELLTQQALEPDPTEICGVAPDELTCALESLPLEFREAIWLTEVEEFTMAEAAEILQIPIGTAASRAYRARRMLRERLAPDGGRGES